LGRGKGKGKGVGEEGLRKMFGTEAKKHWRWRDLRICIEISGRDRWGM